jgi:hypothetical protein
MTVQKGTFSAVVTQDPADANKMTFKVRAYGWSLPRVEPGEGKPWVNMNQTVAPAPPNTPGQYDVTIVSSSKGTLTFRVQNSDGYITQDVFAGVMPYHDSENYRLTQQERWDREVTKAKDMAKAKDELGSDPGNTVHGYTVKDPTQKQSDA